MRRRGGGGKGVFHTFLNKLCPLYPLPDLRLVVEVGVGHESLV